MPNSQNHTIPISELTNISITGIDLTDYPEFCDAYIESATWRSTGIELTEDELQRINPREAHNLIALEAISG
jgi:hypothetical protein